MKKSRKSLALGVPTSAVLILFCGSAYAQFHLDTDEEAAAKLNITVEEFRARVAAVKAHDAPENARMLAATLKRLHDAEAARLAAMRAASDREYEERRAVNAQALVAQRAEQSRSLDEWAAKKNLQSSALMHTPDTQPTVGAVHTPPWPRNVPAKPDPLAPASAPSQTAESRRAAGLPDDPSAAACIQDDDCARAVLRGGSAAPKQ